MPSDRRVRRSTHRQAFRDAVTEHEVRPHVIGGTNSSAPRTVGYTFLLRLAPCDVGERRQAAGQRDEADGDQHDPSGDQGAV